MAKLPIESKKSQQLQNGMALSFTTMVMVGIFGAHQCDPRKCGRILGVLCVCHFVCLFAWLRISLRRKKIGA